jgi:hypothetical protein
MTHLIKKREGTGRANAELRLLAAERLRARREEIYEAVIHRALSVAPPSGGEASGYVEALRGSIPAAVDYAFEAMEVGEDRMGPTPAAILIQAASSAQSQVGMEVVLLRYAAGFTILSDFLHQEMRTLCEEFDPGYTGLQRELTALFDRLVVEVSEAYRREQARAHGSPGQRRLQRIRRLLAGELVDGSGLDYQLPGRHHAIIVCGQEAVGVARGIARRLGRELLLGDASSDRVAVWLGGSTPIDEDALDDAIRALGKSHRFCLGEPGMGLVGWRRTLRQAEAAHLVSKRSDEGVTRYRDVALVSAALRDPDLGCFLVESFVKPIGGTDSPLAGTTLLFLKSDGNASSAAAALGVSRRTVANRIRTVEMILGQPLRDCSAQLETALRLGTLHEP